MTDTAPTVSRKPKVSIMLITYNHEKYIAQALDSILMQETEYDYEINVIEDCSTDRTQEIIMGYVEKYPDKVKPFFNKKNIGFKVTQKNFFRGFKTLKGDYIAILEGDDYWSSPHKLQKQITFLESHPDYVACAHNTIKIYEDGSEAPHRFRYRPDMPADHTVEDLILLKSYFHITTLMFRNVLKDNPPPQFENPWSCERFIVIAHAQFGNIRYFDEDMAFYRAHSGGRFSTLATLDGWFFNIGGLRRYNQWLGYRYFKPFSRSIIQYCNVVLRDKGKEAAPLTRLQFIKYLGIRSIYQISYALACVADKLPTKPVAKIPRDKPVPAYARAVFSWLVYSLKAGARVIQQLVMGLVTAIYGIVSELLPESAKDGIRNFEASHRGIGALRMLIRQGRLLSRRGRKVAYLTAAYNLGLRTSPRHSQKSFAQPPQPGLHSLHLSETP